MIIVAHEYDSKWYLCVCVCVCVFAMCVRVLCV